MNSSTPDPNSSFVCTTYRSHEVSFSAPVTDEERTSFESLKLFLMQAQIEISNCSRRVNTSREEAMLWQATRMIYVEEKEGKRGGGGKDRPCSRKVSARGTLAGPEGGRGDKGGRRASVSGPGIPLARLLVPPPTKMPPGKGCLRRRGRGAAATSQFGFSCIKVKNNWFEATKVVWCYHSFLVRKVI